MFKFIIPGKVQAKQSVKFGQIKTKTGKIINTKYTPKEIVSYANFVRFCFQEEYPNHLPSIFYAKPIRFLAEVHMKVPKSFSEKQRQLALVGKIWPTKKPDWDNISKNICDALNGIAYPDDKQICDGRVVKLYDETDYTIIRFGEIVR